LGSLDELKKRFLWRGRENIGENTKSIFYDSKLTLYLLMEVAISPQKFPCSMILFFNEIIPTCFRNYRLLSLKSLDDDISIAYFTRDEGNTSK
jgi:hypothetical protein